MGELERRGLAAFLAGPPPNAPPELRKAVEEFNEGAFWQCHETLEDLWRGTPYPLRFFYHAIIKAAVGFHHAGRHNRRGAGVKLADGARLLRLFPPQYMGIGTGRLLEDVSRWLARVDPSASVDWSELDSLSRPAILTVGRATDLQ